MKITVRVGPTLSSRGGLQDSLACAAHIPPLVVCTRWSREAVARRDGCAVMNACQGQTTDALVLLQACKDTQTDPDFVVVARVEAFIAGWDCAEALRRAEAYVDAGADAILMHSKKSKPRDWFARARGTAIELVLASGARAVRPVNESHTEPGLVVVAGDARRTHRH